MSDSGFGSDPVAPETPPAAAPAPLPASVSPAPALPAAASVAWAGFWIRVCASLVDLVILFFLSLAADAVIRVAAGVPVAPIWKSSSGATLGLNCAENLVETVLWWLYTALCESSPAQATPGKRLFRLKVTDTEGRRISFGRATGRNFGKFLSALSFFVGFIMAGFTRRHQALHDFLAETVVLRFPRS